MEFLNNLFFWVILFFSGGLSIFFTIMALRSAQLFKKDFLSADKEEREKIFKRLVKDLSKVAIWFVPVVAISGLLFYLLFDPRPAFVLAAFLPMLGFSIMVNWLLKDLGDFFLQTEFNEEFRNSGIPMRFPLLSA